MASIGLLAILFIVLLGLGVIVAVTLIIVVVGMSRREDFVNPFPARKPDRQPTREVSGHAPKRVFPDLPSRSVESIETALVDWLVEQASAQTDVKLVGDPLVRDRILNATRNAMRELESEDSTKISLPFLTADSNGPKHFEITLTRPMMDQIQ